MVRDAIIEEIRERTDILEVIGDHVALKRSGKTWRGPCPLHGGEGPNFSVDPVRGIFKCFVCGEGGDVFAFLMKHLGMEFPDAVRHLAERAGVELPSEREERRDPWGRLREALAFAAEWFAARLSGPEGEAARSYLAGRGVDAEERERFRLGWAPDSWRALREAAHAHGLDDELLLEAGLVATSERAPEPYDRFRGRLMFSILDLRDRPVAFGGRVLDGEGDAPKYINSPESPVFHKSRTLYGLSWARHTIRREDAALLAEGYMDVLALHRHGHTAAVAPLGTALTAEQARALARYGRRLYLLYDSDAPGLRATFRAGDVALAAGLHPLVVTLPPGEDPDSLLAAGGAGALGPLLDQAVDVLERKLQILEREGYLENVEGRRRAVDGVLSTLRAVEDPALRDIYLERAAERIGVRRETLVHEMVRERRSRPGGGRSRSRRAGASEAETGAGGPEPRGAERGLLLLLVRDPRLIGTAEARGLEASHFRDPVRRSIYEALREADPAEGAGELAARLGGAEAERLQALASDATEIVHPREALEEYLRRVVHREALERLDEIDAELSLADAGQQRRLLEEKQALARELRERGVPLSFVRRFGGAGAAPGGA